MNEEFEITQSRKLESDIVQMDSLALIKEELFLQGFDSTQVIIEKDLVIVEGDIVMKADDLYKSIMSRQVRSAIYVDNGLMISVGVDRTSLPEYVWVELVKEVLAIYNADTGLNFYYSEDNPDIIVKKGSISNASVCAQAALPTTRTTPGSYIEINSNNSMYTSYSYSQRLFVLMHEMGHTIGLKHTDTGLSDGGILIEGTPENDYYSFMNSSVGGWLWEGFTESDLIALHTLWPRRFTISFDGSRSDISFREGDSVKIDWKIYPELVNNGGFTGWYYDCDLTEECEYGTIITTSTTLYPKNVESGASMSVSKTSTDYVDDNRYFTLTHGQVISVTCTVRKALNEWEDIDRYIDETGGVITSYGHWPYETLHFYMEPYIFPSEAGNYVSNTWKVYLPKGTYIYDAFFTKSLGEQNSTANQKHGTSQITINYKE